MSFFTEFIGAVWELIKLPFTLVTVGLHRMIKLGLHKLTHLIFAAVVLSGVTLFTLLEVSSNPKFCSSCHLMRPYIDAWKNSSHANVNCMSCHAQEGLKGYFETKFTAMSMLANYFTGLYRRSRPWAEIEDANCMQCHDTRLLEGRTEWTKGIMFDHKPHLTEERRGRRLRCTSCHSQIVQGEHITVTSSTCFLCHFKNVEQEHRADLAECTKCHSNPPTGDQAVEAGLFDHGSVVHDHISCQACHKKMWQGSGEVRRESCGTCHAEEEHIDRINDLEFIHEWHIEKRKVECQTCHDKIEHRHAVIDRDFRNRCSDCHYDKHSLMSEVFQGRGARLIDVELPDPMFLDRVVCISCHKIDPETRRAQPVGDDACLPCHEQSYIRLMDDWRKSFDEQIADLEKSVKRSKPHPKLEDAKHDIAFIRGGGAWHNPTYSQAVLAAVTAVVQEAGGNPRVLPPALSESHKCIKCHSGVKTMNISLPGSMFNHLNHLSLRELSCMTCHPDIPPENPDHGKRLAVAGNCQACHHGVKVKDNDLCLPCHDASRRIFTGDVPGFDNGPSPMSDGGMVCSDCHDKMTGFTPPKDEFCLDCHGEETVDQLVSSRTEIEAALTKSDNKSKASQLLIKDPGRAVHHPDLAKKILGLH